MDPEVNGRLALVAVADLAKRLEVLQGRRAAVIVGSDVVDLERRFVGPTGEAAITIPGLDLSL